MGGLSINKSSYKTQVSLKPVELLSHDYLINHISMQYNRDKEKEFFYYANRKPTNPNNSRQLKSKQIRLIKSYWLYFSKERWFY